MLDYILRSSVSTPWLRRRFDRINRKKPYAKQVKPFNFLVSVPVDSIEWPPEAFEFGGFHLIAPYSNYPSEWLDLSWTDVHSGNTYRIRTDEPSSPTGIRVQTFARYLDRFRNHPEAKSAGPDGNPSDQWTKGLLCRLDVQVLGACHIGKEANLLEEQEKGVLPTDPQKVYPGGGEWETIRSSLSRVSIPELAARSGVSERMLQYLQKGERRPSAKTLKAIEATLVRMLGET